ncbi:MAG: UTRA domain-containing protein [Anaerolineae bacterium]|nr:UTRA domain-containing protein [Anaerolineae bacterium]
MQDIFSIELQRQLEQEFLTTGARLGDKLTVVDAARHLGADETDVAAVLLAALRKGLVERIQGPGAAFRILGLAEPAVDSVYIHTAAAGLKPRSKVRTVEVEPASRLIAAMLHLEEGNPVYHYVRTRYVGDEVLANQTSYVPYIVCPGLEEQDLAHRSFQRILEQEYNAVVTDVQEECEVSTATEEDVHDLGVPRGGPVLLVERLALSRTRWPLIWANLRIRPDRYEYVQALWPGAAELLAEPQ